MRHSFTKVGKVAGARNKKSHRGERFYNYCQRCKTKRVGRYAEGACPGTRTFAQYHAAA